MSSFLPETHNYEIARSVLWQPFSFPNGKYINQYSQHVIDCCLFTCHMQNVLCNHTSARTCSSSHFE